MAIIPKRAHELALKVPMNHHTPDCTYRTTYCRLGCTCHVVKEHPEFLDGTALYGEGGVVLERYYVESDSCFRDGFPKQIRPSMIIAGFLLGLMLGAVAILIL